MNKKKKFNFNFVQFFFVVVADFLGIYGYIHSHSFIYSSYIEEFRPLEFIYLFIFSMFVINNDNRFE